MMLSNSPTRMMLLGMIVLVTPQTGLCQELEVTPTFTSDYDFRGVTQTANEPAVQLGIDWTGVLSHLEVWTSNINFDSRSRFYGSGHSEIAFSADVFRTINSALKFDAGVNYYLYPGLSPADNYPESFVTVSSNGLSVSIYYSWKYDDTQPQLDAYYGSADLVWPIGVLDTNILLHFGENWGEYWETVGGGSYSDYSVGLRRRVGHFDLTLRLVGTRDYLDVSYHEAFSGRRRVVFSIETSFSPADR